MDRGTSGRVERFKFKTQFIIGRADRASGTFGRTVEGAESKSVRSFVEFRVFDIF